MKKERYARLVALLKRLRLAGSDSAPPFERYGATPSQVAVLEALAVQPGCGVKDLARALGLSPPTVSVALLRLEAAGLVNRAHNEEDARALRLEPTERGSALLKELNAFRDEKSEYLLASLSPKDADTFLDLLEKILAARESPETLRPDSADGRGSALDKKDKRR